MYGLRLCSHVRPKRPWPTNETTDRANMYMIYWLNNHACTPTINQPTDRQALYLTTITTAASTVLLPKQAFAACDLPIN